MAEQANVKLAMHPDDPPLSPIRGLGRIMRSLDNYQRLLDLVPSPVNGITLCQGNFTLMTDDLPPPSATSASRRRSSSSTSGTCGGRRSSSWRPSTTKARRTCEACMEAYRDVGFDGVCPPGPRAHHGGDDNDRPAYSSIGRLFAIGYLKGLREAVYGERGSRGRGQGRRSPSVRRRRIRLRQVRAKAPCSDHPQGVQGPGEGHVEQAGVEG